MHPSQMTASSSAIMRLGLLSNHHMKKEEEVTAILKVLHRRFRAEILILL